MSKPIQVQCGSPSSVDALLQEKISDWPVCQIAYKEDSNRGGTGFLIAPGVVMTCAHVIPDEETAKKTQLQFHMLSGKHTVQLDPDILFETSPSPGEGKFCEEHKLDYTIVALSMDKLPPEIAKLQREIRSIFEENVTGPTMKGMQRISIVHYPSLPRETKTRIFGFNEFEIEWKNAYNLLHRISTEEGSSGAPLFDQEGRLIGVHRMGKQSESHGCSTPIEPILVNLEAFQERIRGLQQSAPSTPNLMQIASPYNYFTNRAEELEKIQESLEKSYQITLWGPGGIGKTELALKYAYNHLGDYWLIWIFASSTQESLESSYRVLAKELGISFQGEESNRMIIDHVHVRLNEDQPKRWLLIYDDYDRSYEHLEEFELPSTIRGHLILTSRVSNPTMDSIAVEEFSEEHSKELITKITMESHSDSMDELITLCGLYPLMLSRAALYIKRMGKKIEKYIKKFPKKEDLLRRPPDKRYKKTFEEIVQQTLKYLNPEVQSWVRVCSLLEAKYIPNLYLKKWLKITDPDGNTWQLEEDALMALSEHAIQRKQGKQLEMHQLFVDVPIETEDQDLLRKAGQLLSEIALEKNWYFRVTKTYAEDLLSASEWRELVIVLLKNENFKKIDLEYRNYILFYCAEIEQNIGEYKTALRHWEEVLNIRIDLKKKYPNSSHHDSYPSIYTHMGFCHLALERFDAAFEYFKKAYEEISKRNQEDWPDLDVQKASARYEMGYCFQKLREFDKAIEEYEASLEEIDQYEDLEISFEEKKVIEKKYHLDPELAKKSANDRCKTTKANAKSQIAMSILESGENYDYNNILTLCEEALELRREVFEGENHPDVALSYFQIGRCHEKSGEIEKAEKCFKNASDIRKALKESLNHR